MAKLKKVSKVTDKEVRRGFHIQISLYNAMRQSAIGQGVRPKVWLSTAIKRYLMAQQDNLTMHLRQLFDGTISNADLTALVARLGNAHATAVRLSYGDNRFAQHLERLLRKAERTVQDRAGLMPPVVNVVVSPAVSRRVKLMSRVQKFFGRFV
jgi:hypothetical protein